MKHQILKIIIFNCFGLNGGRINPIKCKLKTKTQVIANNHQKFDTSNGFFSLSEFSIKCSTWNEHLNVLDFKNSQPYDIRVMVVNLCLVFIMQLLRNNGNGTAVQYKSIWMSMSIWCFNLWANLAWHGMAWRSRSVFDTQKPKTHRKVKKSKWVTIKLPNQTESTKIMDRLIDSDVARSIWLSEYFLFRLFLMMK